MSGGVFDYLFYKIDNMADEIGIEELEFAEFLRKVSKLAKSIEWAYSGDTSIEEFQKDWKKFKKENLK